MAYAAPDATIEVKAVAVELPSLTQRIEYVESFLEETLDQRKSSMRDRDFYDGHQWDKDDLAKLKRRKQPALVKNLIAPKVNYVLGEEILRRVDPVALPRTIQHDGAARAATDALRFVEEEQQFDVVRSSFAKNLMVEGTGGVIKELEQGTDRVKHKLRHIEWDRLIWDPHSRSLLFEDAKFLGILMWMDLDDAVIQWPDAAEALKAVVHNDISREDQATSDKPTYSWVDAKRERVQVAELYIRIDDSWYKTCFTQAADLSEPAPTGFLDEEGQRHLCPLRLASCYIDREGRRYGIVRNMISPQEALNKHSSKLLHIVNTKAVIAERDSVNDPQKFQTEIAKPDGFAEVEPGALAGRIQIIDGMQLATAHLQLIQESKADINGIGPTASQVPDLPASSSGRALLARQKAASQELGNPFDTIRQWTKGIFELDWLCIRQTWTDELWLRVTDGEERTGYRFVALNRQMTRAQRFQELMQKGTEPQAAFSAATGTDAPYIMADVQRMTHTLPPEAMQQSGPDLLPRLILSHPAMQAVIVENQVDKMLMDIIIDEAPETAVIQQEEFEKLVELAQTIIPQRPDMAPKMTTMILKASQLRDKRELLEEIEKQSAPNPQAEQAQQEAMALQKAQLEAGVAVTQSQAQLNAAKAQSEQAKTQMAGAKVPSEIERNKAASMRDAAHAGAASALPVHGEYLP